MGRQPGFDRSALIVSLASLVALAACTPAPAPGASAPAPAPREQAAQRKTLTFGVRGEPRGLGQLFIGGANIMAPIFTTVHDFLVRLDDRGRPVPALAGELIAQEKGTWVVNQDGTMVTTWKLRPNVRWHDGTPFHPDDLIFGWKVSVHPDVPYSPRRVADAIERIEAPDAQTAAIHWKRPYPFADRLELPDLYALPRHILQRTFEEDPKALQTLPYWNREFIGLGPYKMKEWMPGSHMILEANPEYHLGKPKVDTQTHKFIDDDNTMLANVLAGEIDIIVPASTVRPEQQQTIRDQWESAGQGQIVPNLVGRFRHVGIALRNPTLQDVRLRQALLYGLDREGIAEAVVLDPNRKIDSWILPSMERYQRAKSRIQTYNYDPTRAAQLLEEAGYRGAPTAVTVSAGERLRVEYRSSGPGGLKEMSLSCANWRSLGILCDETPTTGPLGQDAEWRATFQWFDGTAGPASMGFIGRRLHSSQIPTAETRWQGSNDGAIRDLEADRLVDLFNRSVSTIEQERIEIDLASLVSRQLYVYPLYSEVTVMVIRKGITGPRPMAAVGASGDLWNTWNVHEWDRT